MGPGRATSSRCDPPHHSGRAAHYSTPPPRDATASRGAIALGSPSRATPDTMGRSRLIRRSSMSRRAPVLVKGLRWGGVTVATLAALVAGAACNSSGGGGGARPPRRTSRRSLLRAARAMLRSRRPRLQHDVVRRVALGVRSGLQRDQRAGVSGRRDPGVQATRVLREHLEHLDEQPGVQPRLLELDLQLGLELRRQ